MVLVVAKFGLARFKRQPLVVTTFLKEHEGLPKVSHLHAVPIAGTHPFGNSQIESLPFGVPLFPADTIVVFLGQEVLSASLLVGPGMDRLLAVSTLLAARGRRVLDDAAIGTGWGIKDNRRERPLPGKIGVRQGNGYVKSRALDSHLARRFLLNHYMLGGKPAKHVSYSSEHHYLTAR